MYRLSSPASSPLARPWMANGMSLTMPTVETYAGLERLPTAPGALLSYLERPNGCPSAAFAGRHASASSSRFARAWDEISTILGNGLVMPPRFGRAIFAAAARIPGVVLLPTVVDVAGRHGIAVARTAAGLRTELIFEPHSYRFIGVQDIVLRPVPGLRAGTNFAGSALLQARVVNAAPVTPANQSLGVSECSTFLPGPYSVGSSGSAVAPPPSGSSSAGSSSSGSGPSSRSGSSSRSGASSRLAPPPDQ